MSRRRASCVACRSPPPAPTLPPPGLLAVVTYVTSVSSFVTQVVFSGVVAICINFSTTLVLGVTSALSLVLLGQVGRL